MRITKVYTRTGDAGKTSLVSGDRVSKADLRVSAYGDVDELNSVLGVVRTFPLDVELNELLGRLQNDLFTVGADLATPAGTPVPRVSPEMVTELEQVIDKYLEELEPLKEFILPGGSNAGAMLHLARTVARRAERVVVALAEREEITAEALQYLNRLSDLLFVLARVANKRAGTVEQSAQFSQRHQRRTEAK
ncbi:MAG: cob(I)yrinic acid a,c-diamide adenosyltransferase [Blastocatellia bacterium]